MAKELIVKEADGTISFGDYTLPAKTKLDGFEHEGDLYKVKTFNEITKLEKNGMFVYESVPGTEVKNLKVTAGKMEFKVLGKKDAQITVEMAEDKVYNVSINGTKIGEMKTNLGGKLSLSVELDENTETLVSIEEQ